MWKDAVTDYTTALQLDGQRGDAYAWRGQTHQRLDNLDAAIHDYRQAIKSGTGVKWAWVEWSSALIAFDRADRVVSDLNEMLHFVRSNPNSSARAYEQLAEVYSFGPAEARNPKLALELAGRARDLKPEDSSYLTTLGVAYYRLDEFDQAARYLERRLEERQGGGSYYQYFFLAMCYAKQERDDEAQAMYDNAFKWLKDYEGLSGGGPGESNVKILFDRMKAEADAALDERRSTTGGD